MTHTRTCVGCRETASDRELLRVVREDNSVVPDPKRVLPGRGGWIHARPECVDLADRRRAWVRAFRATGALDASAVREWVQARV